jgi:hypothetical protein
MIKAAIFFTLLNLSHAGGAELPQSQVNSLAGDGFGDSSTVALNTMEIDGDEIAVLGFGGEQGSTQENSAFVQTGDVLVHDNEASFVNENLNLFGNVIGGGEQIHAQENFASTGLGDVLVSGNSDLAIQEDTSLLGNVFSVLPNRKEASQWNAGASTLGNGIMNGNTFVAEQRNNNGLLTGSLFGGSRKDAEQFNQIVAPNGFGESVCYFPANNFRMITLPLSINRTLRS